eukprot:6654923-Pyramimonas_sp.AAC.1
MGRASSREARWSRTRPGCEEGSWSARRCHVPIPASSFAVASRRLTPVRSRNTAINSRTRFAGS